DEELLKSIEPVWAKLGEPPPASEPLPMLITVRFRRGDLALNLFSIHATLGTQLDVTLQELRIEMFFPADEPTKRILERRPRGPASAGNGSRRAAAPPRRGSRRPTRASNAARRNPARG
ncbi:MAG TPA: hypothetical protein VLM79_33535, partial [Kofleriaceae bacterium]|nr:hypothetical protein [Kofleriaceae bacterium]